jgi:transposase-like protein
MAWLRYPKAAMTEIVRHGRDRLDRRRFRCKACRRTFFAPPFTGGMKRPFKEHMRVELHLARAGEPNEPIATVARRLGISRTTAITWEKAIQVAGPPTPVLPEVLVSGRRARLLFRLEDAPYAVGDIDRERHLRATAGEMRHYLGQREFPERKRILGSVVNGLRDRTTPFAAREAKAHEVGRWIEATFAEDLKHAR